MGKSAIATKISLALGLIVAMIFGSAPVGAFAAVIRSTYIVQVQEGHASEVRDAIGLLGETPHDELTEVMDGFVIDLTDTEVAALRLEPYVMQVVADAPMSLMDTQSPVPSWGLDRIDQNVTAGDGAYNYPSSAGAGVRVYVVDTGVMASNPDFAGRMLPGIDMYGQNLEAADCQGHGTHVAGTIAGTKYGVAKKALIVPVRVLSCSGSGSWSYFISAMDWIIANNPAGTPAVMSASIGGGNYSLANAAVEKLYAAGITPVIAAGNSNVDACGTSPAGAPNAITVGASDINDARASYSNWGECVDVFAPGSNIISDSNTDPTAGVSKSGTSMATPHVSGLAALYLSANPAASPAAVTSAIKAGGLAGAVANSLSTIGNILISNSFTRASVPVTPAPVNPPTGLTASAITNTGATISWTAPVVDPAVASTPPSSYLVEYRITTSTTWSSTTTTATTVNLSGLVGLSNYVVRVASVAGQQTSTPTPELQFSTLGTAPDAPTNLTSTAIYGNQIDLAWTAPQSNGSTILYYYLEQQVSGNWTRIAQPYGKSWSVTKLTATTSYSFRIQAVNALGAGPYSNVYTASTTAATPVTPTALVASNIQANSVTVSWKASPTVDTNSITYVATLTSRTTGTVGVVLGTFQTSTNAYTFTGLKRATSYGVTVVAYSGTMASAPSSMLIITTAASKPSAPTSGKVTKTSSEATLGWLSPADNGGLVVTAYQIEKQNSDSTWSILATQDVSLTSYVVPLPLRGTAANYRVSAVNGLGAGDPLAITVTTPATTPGSPSGLALTRGTTTSALSWIAPTDDGASAVLGYGIFRSSDNGTTWSQISSSVTTTVTISIPAKGVKYLYSVAARNAVGYGSKSNSVSDETVATAPGAVSSVRYSYPTPEKLQIVWTAPYDLGGTSITAYRLERQAADGTWTVLNESNVLSFQIDRDLPGVLVTLRIAAINNVGAGAAITSSWRTPFVKATAPQNFAVTDTGTAVRVTWSAPENLGGSVVSYYTIQVSKDNGTTWLGLTNVASSLTSLNVTRPIKGQTWTYRIYAVTGFGIGEYSSTASITSALTAPSAPNVRSLILNSDVSTTLTWALPADNGGTPLIAIVIEKSKDNLNWSALPELSASVTSASFAKEVPGVRVYYRLRATNSVGTSNTSSTYSLLTPFLKASAPQDFAASDTGSAVALSWTAPLSLGGSSVSAYALSISRDAGATWTTSYSFAASALTANVPRPTKGQTWSYRLAARTAFGYSEDSAVVSIASALTVSSAPILRNLVLNGDGTLTANWSAPSDLGGTALTGYVVERSSDNVTWSAFPAVGATVLTLTIPGNGPGARTYLRVKATNSVGASAASSVATVIVPYVKASAPLALTATLANGRVQLTWSAPANTGGSAISYYQVESSANSGANWNLSATTSGLTVSFAAPTKGTTMSYRVAARTGFGLSDYSTVSSATSPTTVTSNVRLTGLSKVATGSFGLSFATPTDLGGYANYTYRVEVQVNNVWTVAATGVGGASTYVVVNTPGTTLAYNYRVIANNPSGDSQAVTFSYKG